MENVLPCIVSQSSFLQKPKRVIVPASFNQKNKIKNWEKGKTYSKNKTKNKRALISIRRGPQQ